MIKGAAMLNHVVNGHKNRSLILCTCVQGDLEKIPSALQTSDLLINQIYPREALQSRASQMSV